MKWLFMLLPLLGGVAVGLQASINGGLGKKIGTLEASFVSFAIGTLALLFIVIFFGKGNILAVIDVPKWQLLGGLLGAFYVFVVIISVPKMGVASTLMIIILGQFVIGAIIDHFGLFGGKQIPFDWNKLIATILFIAAIILFNKK